MSDLDFKPGGTTSPDSTYHKTEFDIETLPSDVLPLTFLVLALLFFLFRLYTSIPQTIPIVFHAFHKSMATECPDISVSRPCARDFAKEVCRGHHRTNCNGITALHVPRYGNYGNHFIELVLFIYFSLIMNIRTIYVDQDLCWLEPHTTLQIENRVTLITVEKQSSVPLQHKQYISVSLFSIANWCPDFTWRYVAEWTRKTLLTAMPNVTVDPEALYIYIRGGRDIWTGDGGNKNYGQPPCSFYLDAMRGFEKVRAIGDLFNPCTSRVIRAGASWEPYNDRADMARMVYSRYIVLARSSRSHVILALSPFRKHFWFFDKAVSRQQEPDWWRGFYPLDFGDGKNCVPSPTYREAIRKWRAAPSQIDLMLSSNCTWEEMR